jgi:ribosomal protein S18 acetylase RimI-like enzyme
MERDARLDRLTLQLLTADDWRTFREVRMAALAEAPYAFGTELAQWQGEGDREERWRQRLIDVPFNAVAYFDGRPAGMVGATHPNEHGEIKLISMWVAPPARGRGTGDALVLAVLAWARERRIGAVILDVVESNARARAFYRRMGFADLGPVDGGPPGRPHHRMRHSNPAS